jgi:two-component sensor histidine kinase
MPPEMVIASYQGLLNEANHRLANTAARVQFLEQQLAEAKQAQQANNPAKMSQKRPALDLDWHCHKST